MIILGVGRYRRQERGLHHKSRRRIIIKTEHNYGSRDGEESVVLKEIWKEVTTGLGHGLDVKHEGHI